MLVLILGLVVLGLIGWRLHYSLTYWKRRGIPYETPHFFFGNLKTWKSSHHIIEIFDPLYKKYKGSGPFAGFYFLQKPTALILDLDLLKNILVKDFRNFYERGTYHNQRDDPLTGHLFRLGGPNWKPLRQKLSPTFTSGKMKYMFPTVYNIGLELKNVLTERLEATDNRGQVMEVANLMGRFTADVIGVCAFGLNCNSLREPDAEFVTMGKKAFVMRRHNKFIDFFIESSPDLARKLHIKQIHPEIHEFYFRIVKDTIKQRLEQNIKKNDFMDMLIDMLNKNEMTIEEIVAQAFIFFIAGFDTSSSTMAFALYELALNPHIQDKLRLEINDVFKRHNEIFSYECMKDMAYLKQIISETLRKYPVLPHITRLAADNYPLANPKYNIEKGTFIIIPINSIHWDPDYYPNPDIFDPDRFLPEEIAKRPSCSWIPFGDGPRNCIGFRFGEMQASIGLFFMIKYFKFSRCSDTEVPLTWLKSNQLLCPENGINLKVEKV